MEDLVELVVVQGEVQFVPFSLNVGWVESHRRLNLS